MRLHKPNHQTTARLNEQRLLQMAIRRSKLEFGSGPTICSSEWEEIPVIQPTPEMFDEPISLWFALNDLGNKFGAVKLKPPDGWKPPFCLNFSKLEFTARKQKLHRLLSRKAFEFPKKRWTAQEFCDYNSSFTQKYNWNTKTAETPTSLNNEKLIGSQKKFAHSINDYEKEYWYLVNSQSSPVDVLYGADLDCSRIGSGFPCQTTTAQKGYSDCVSSSTMSYYATHPWNLLNLPNVNGSLLRSFDRIIPGVTSPWLYIGMLFSSFCWHTEDDYLASVNYQHCGEPKVWYIIPPDKASTMQKFLKQYFSGLRTETDVLHSLTVQVSPEILKRNEIPIYRSIQRENEFILLWPRAYHCGFNTGFNCNEACNLAPPQWLPWGYKAFLSYRFLRQPCIPFEQLVALACSHCLTIRRYDEIESLLAEFTRLLIDEFRMRSDLPETLIQLPISIPPLPSSFSGLAKKNEVFERAVAAIPSLKTPINPATCTDEEFCSQYRAASRLPILECSSCLTACCSVICCCIHTTKFLCIRCAVDMNPYPCNKEYCEQSILFYRFPLGCQLRMLKLLETVFLNLSSSKVLPLSTSQLKSTDYSIPCLNKCMQFEEARAGKFHLSSLQPFFSSPVIANKESSTKLLSSDSALTLLYTNLAARHLTSVLDHETSQSESGDEDDEDEEDEEDEEDIDFYSDDSCVLRKKRKTNSSLRNIKLRPF